MYKDLPTKTCWYDNMRIGKNTMGTMMSSVSKAVKLSKKYTNHSIRATFVTILDSCDFDARHIMSISKHKNESSIRSYSSRVRYNTRKDMRPILSEVQVQNVHSFNLPGPNFQHCQVNFTYIVYQTTERP